MAAPRIARVFGAVNIGSFRISAMIAGISETGEMVVLGSGHRAARDQARLCHRHGGRDLCRA
jgi:cell division protein FtsA